jgi:hypothetical protein
VGEENNYLESPFDTESKPAMLTEQVYYECNLKPLFERILREAGLNMVQPVSKIPQIPSRLPQRNQDQKNSANQENHNEESEPEPEQNQQELITYDKMGKKVIHYSPGKAYS